MAFVSRMRYLRAEAGNEITSSGVLAPVLGGLEGVAPGPADSFLLAVRELSLPVMAAVQPAQPATPVKEAILLLQIVAEVEHAFLLQYLYAAYSLNTASCRRCLWKIRDDCPAGNGPFDHSAKSPDRLG